MPPDDNDNPLDACTVDWLAGALSQDGADVEEHLSDLEMDVLLISSAARPSPHTTP